VWSEFALSLPFPWEAQRLLRGFKVIGYFPFDEVPYLGQSAELRMGWRCASIAFRLLFKESVDRTRAVQKSHGDFVLPVDKQIDHEVRTELARNYLDDGIISEEGEPVSSRSGRTWIIDPLDATTAYMLGINRRFPSFMIALSVERRIVMSLIHIPFDFTTFVAMAGHGAFIHTDEKIIQAPKRREVKLSEAWVECNRYSDVQYETPWFASLGKTLRSPNGAALVTSQVPHSSASCWMAAAACWTDGQPNAVVHDNSAIKVKQDLWDLAAPTLFVREAGGVVLNSAGQHLDPFSPEPAIFSSSEKLALEIVAAGKG